MAANSFNFASNSSTQHDVGDDPFMKYCSQVAELMARHAQVGYMHSGVLENANQKVGFEPRVVKVGSTYSFMYQDSGGHHHTIELALVTGAKKISTLLDAYSTPQGVDPRAAWAAWQHPEVQQLVHDQVYASVLKDLAASTLFKTKVYDKLSHAPIEQVFKLPDNYVPPSHLPNALDLRTELMHMNASSPEAYKSSAHAMSDVELGYNFNHAADSNRVRVNIAMLIGVDQTLQNVTTIAYDAHDGLVAALRSSAAHTSAMTQQKLSAVPVQYSDGSAAFNASSYTSGLSTHPNPTVPPFASSGKLQATNQDALDQQAFHATSTAHTTSTATVPHAPASLHSKVDVASGITVNPNTLNDAQVTTREASADNQTQTQAPAPTQVQAQTQTQAPAPAPAPASGNSTPHFNFGDVQQYVHGNTSGGTQSGPGGVGSSPITYQGVTYKEYTTSEEVKELLGYTGKTQGTYGADGSFTPGSPGGEPIYVTRTVTKVHTVREQMLKAFVDKYYDAYVKKVAEVVANNSADGYLNFSENGISGGTDSRLQADLVKGEDGHYSFDFKDSAGNPYHISLKTELGEEKSGRITKWLDTHLVDGVAAPGMFGGSYSGKGEIPKVVDSRAAMAVWKMPEINKIVKDEVYAYLYTYLKTNEHFKTHTFGKMGHVDPSKLYIKPADHFQTDITQAAAQLKDVLDMDAAAYKALEVKATMTTKDENGNPVVQTLDDNGQPTQADIEKEKMDMIMGRAYGTKGGPKPVITPAHLNLPKFPDDPTENLTGSQPVFADSNGNMSEDIVRMSLYLQCTPGLLEEDDQIGFDKNEGIITGTMNVKANQPDSDWFDFIIPIIIIGIVTWGIGAAVDAGFASLTGTSIATASAEGAALSFTAALPQAFVTAGLTGLATSAINGTPFSVENLLIGTFMPAISSQISSGLKAVLPNGTSSLVVQGLTRTISSLAAQALGGQDLDLQSAVLSGSASLVASGVTKMLLPEELSQKFLDEHYNAHGVPIPREILDQISMYTQLGAMAADVYGHYSREMINDPSGTTANEHNANAQSAAATAAERPPFSGTVPDGAVPIYGQDGRLTGYRDAQGVVHTSEYHVPMHQLKIDPHLHEHHNEKVHFGQALVANYSGKAFQTEPTIFTELAGTQFGEDAQIFELYPHLNTHAHPHGHGHSHGHGHHFDGVHVVFHEPAMAVGFEHVGAGFGHQGVGGQGGGYNGKA